MQALTGRRSYREDSVLDITLRPITTDNWVECIELTPTEEQQQHGFVATNVLSLAQAYAEPWWNPLAIYSGDTMVGFVMYGRWPETGIPKHHGSPEPGVDYILRMMIDEHHQGRGYGRAAMQALIDRIKRQPGCREIQLDYDSVNVVAERLYSSLGFRPIYGSVDGEITARLVIAEAAGGD